MIDFLDNMLRQLFISRVATITSENQVRFQPPDDDWRNSVANLQNNALNIYLVDIRENRELRSNHRVREFSNGNFSETPAPRRIDCHYLITAWSPANVTQDVEPTVDEHELLYQVTAVLMENEPLNPTQVYFPDPLPGGFPTSIADVELPSTILPVEGFSKLPEFWGTMGTNHRWKPAVYLIVTLPVELKTEIAGPMVTTRITEYRHRGLPETAEVWIRIGGHVLDTTLNPATIPGAWVRLETTANVPLQTTTTNEEGRFTFERLQPGQYLFRWRAGARPEASAILDVPSPDGDYDLIFP